LTGKPRLWWEDDIKMGLKNWCVRLRIILNCLKIDSSDICKVFIKISS
jgi:hypothetical protein